MNEARHACGFSCGEDRAGAIDVAGGEPGSVGGVDHAGDVDDCVRTLGERFGIGEIAGDPSDAVTGRLWAAGECADPVSGGECLGQDMAADEARPASKGKDHSSAR